MSVSNIVGMVGGFLTVVILANLLDKNEYGNYKYVYSLVGMLSVLSLTGGFRTIAVQAGALHTDGTIEKLYKTNFPLSILLFAGSLICGLYYILRGNPVIGLSVAIAGMSTVWGNNGIIASSYLNGKKRYWELLMFQGGLILGNLLTLGITILITKNIFVIIAMNSIVTASISTYYYFNIKKRLLKNDLIDKRLLHYGKHLNWLSIASTFNQYIDSLLIFWLLGSEKLALYAMTTPFVDRIIGFFKAGNTLALPKYTELGPRKAREFLYRRSLFGFLIGLSISCLYILLSPILFNIFFPKYLESMKLSWLFSLNIPLVGLATLPNAYLDSLIEIKNKYKLLSAITISRIVTLPIFIILFGVVGVLWSELISRSVGFITMVILINNASKKNI